MGGLFDDDEDFFNSIDEGMNLIMGPLSRQVPEDEDLGPMKALYSIFVAATVKMDPEAISDPDMHKKLTSVRMALLTAYNLGREREQKEKIRG